MHELVTVNTYVDKIKIKDRNVGFRINSYGPSQRNVARIFRTVTKHTDVLTQNFFTL